jgi:flagellar biosynthesis protein FliR
MTRVLSMLAGNELAGFILVLARITPLFLIAPPFSSPAIPPRVRGVIAVGISIGLAPVALHGQHIPSDPLTLAGLVFEGLLVGFGFAFSFAVLFGAVEAAGALADLGAGFSYGSLINPFDGNQGSVFAHLYSLVGIAIFLMIGGEAWVLRGLAHTFTLVPLTSAPRLASLVGGAEQVFSTVFASAVEVAAPVLIALLITDAAFGVVSRVVPQLNVFAVGFPAKVAVALLVVGASMPFLGGWISNQLSITVGDALGALHVA